MGRVNCSYCGKEYFKDNRHINENIKFGHNFYCSPYCQYTFKNKQLEFSCEKLGCNKKFKRASNDISPHNYCSRSCAAAVNNRRFPKRIAQVKKCVCCDYEIFNRGKYCSLVCKSNTLTISKEKLIYRIRKFYKIYGRIPVKREMCGIYKPARKYFGTWNNAIKAAGFKPNPVMFADRCFANDGHICHEFRSCSRIPICHSRESGNLYNHYLYGFRVKHGMTDVRNSYL